MKSLLIILVILLFCSCNSRQKKEVENETFEQLEKVTIREEFTPIIDEVIDSLDGHSTNVIIVICSRIFDHEYIFVGDNLGYSPDHLKGYAEYKDYLIGYYGIDDSMATKIFYFDNLERSTPDEKYYNLNNWDAGYIFYDPIFDGYYLIDDQNNIIPDDPTPKIRKEMRRQAVQQGFVPPTPPEP